MEVPYDGVIVESTATFEWNHDDCTSVHVPLSSYCDREDGAREVWLESRMETSGGGILVEDKHGLSSSALVGSWSLLQGPDENNVLNTLLVTLMLRGSGKPCHSLAVKATFDVAVFSCSCLAKVAKGILQMGVVTLDGYLHLIVVPYEDDSSRHAEVSSISIADTVDGEFGKPKTLAIIQDTVCLGGDSGGIACFSIIGDTLNNAVTYLGLKSGILGNVASYLGFSQRQHHNATGIECMSVVSMSWGGSKSKGILFCLHANAGLCIWDVEQKVLLHSVTLLHEDCYIPSCLEYSRDVLTEGGIFLIASFENIETNSSVVSLFEVTVDNRNDILSVHIENGPQLPDVDGRITSASLEFLDANRYYMWFITKDRSSQKYKTECVLFQGDSRGNHKSLQYSVVSLESRLESLVASSEEEQEMLKIYFSEIQMALQENGGDHLGNYIIDTVFLPWHFSSVAMTRTFSTLGIPNDYFDDLDKRSLYVSAEKWMKNSSSPLEAFAKGVMFLNTFIGELRHTCAPIHIRVLQQNLSETDTTVFLMRNDGKISILSNASTAESITCREMGKKDPLLSSFQACMKPFIGPAVTSMAGYAASHGLNVRQQLLPCIVKVLSGEVRVNSVEFGKHSSYVRRLWRKFPFVIQSFDLDELRETVFAFLSLDEAEISWRRETNSTMDEVIVSLAKSALYSCSITAIEMGLSLFSVLEYNSIHKHASFDRNSEKTVIPALMSYWACTTPVILDNGKTMLKVPNFSDKAADEHSSKKIKRLELQGKECHAFDVCFDMNQCISQGLLKVKALQDIDALTSLAVGDFMRKQSNFGDLVHVLMHRKDILNKETVIESLLGLVSSLNEIKSVNIRFFQAYVTSKQASLSMDESEKNMLEQKGLSLFLSLCDCIQNPEDADALIDCFESLGRTVPRPLTDEKYIDGIASILDHLGCVSSTTRCGLFSARLQESLNTQEGHENAARIRSRVFKMLEKSRQTEEAYTVALSVLDPKRQRDCLRGLVEHMCTNKDIETLCTLPMTQFSPENDTNVLEQIIYSLWDRALKEAIDESLTYSVLFDLYVTRGNFQSAAAALLSYCRRMAKESTRPNLDILLDLQKKLTVVIGCLKLVNAADAWLEDASQLSMCVKKTFSGNMIVSKEYTLPDILDVRAIEKEFVLVKSLIQIVSVVPDYGIHKTPQEVLYQLLELQLHKEAWDLVNALFSSTEFQKAKEIIVLNLSKQCIVADSPQDWELLKSLIKQEVCLASADRLRLTAADAILEMDTTVGIPPWMMEPYLCKYDILTSSSSPQNHKADSTGMLRILLKHGRIELAGQLAMEVMSPIVTRIPSVALPKGGSVCIPHDLIDSVIHSLASNQDESTALLFKRLSEAKGILEESSSSQSKVLENIF